METYAPFLTRRFDLALQVASGLHHEQAPEGGHIPFIAHLMSVCALVLEAGGDEDQAITALLHHAVEDQGGATLATIRHLFGNRVAKAVEFCSESTTTESSKRLSWRERREKYLDRLRTADEDALFVAAADEVYSAREILADFHRLGDQAFEQNGENRAHRPCS